MESVDIQGKLNTYVDHAIEYAPKILLAVIALVIGLWIINRVVALLRKFIVSKVDVGVANFLTSLFSVLLKVLLFFSVAEMVGIKTTSFVAILAAASLAVGMALQGSLGNFASGVMIMVFKPYRIGDVVQLAGETGEVKDIQIFNTILETPQNKTIIVPNSIATSEKIINNSTAGKIRVDTFTHMPYNDDFDRVKGLIETAVATHPLILKDPAPMVGLEEFGDHNIKLGLFAYCAPADYWTVYYDCNEILKKTLGKGGVKMTYPEGMSQGDIGKA